LANFNLREKPKSKKRRKAKKQPEKDKKKVRRVEKTGGKKNQINHKPDKVGGRSGDPGGYKKKKAKQAGKVFLPEEKTVNHTWQKGVGPGPLEKN